MSKRFFSRMIIVGACASAALMPGCIAVGGSNSHTHPTLGRQLQDLKVARESGAISDADYDLAKSRLLSGELPAKR